MTHIFQFTMISFISFGLVKTTFELIAKLKLTIIAFSTSGYN